MIKFLENRNQKMNISPQMQKKIDKISEYLKANECTLEKGAGGFIYIKNKNDRKLISKVYLWTGKLSEVSWVAFFFAPIVAAQIKCWAYFYACTIGYFIISLIGAVIKLAPEETRITVVSSFSFLDLAIPLIWARSFPFYRLSAIKEGVKENSRFLSILIGLLLTLIAAIPSYAVNFAFDEYRMHSSVISCEHKANSEDGWTLFCTDHQSNSSMQCDPNPASAKPGICKDAQKLNLLKPHTWGVLIAPSTDTFGKTPNTQETCIIKKNQPNIYVTGTYIGLNSKTYVMGTSAVGDHCSADWEISKVKPDPYH
ncbi:putative membrane protein [Synechococcus sp. ROS8604]|nr:putative membrane protein [Synechococcus sp. ROS8604]